MKITLTFTFILLVAAVQAAPASIDPVNVAADASQPDSTRIKRSGFEIVSSIQKSVLSGIGSASAGSAGQFSSSSLGGSSHSSSSSHNSHPVEVPYHGHEIKHETKFDGWQLKKSILNTLFQAVKAITGGVTALKGQLIKGSGYLVSAKGKLISAGGDAVSNVGKKIASSAKLVPSTGHTHSFAKFSAPLSGSSSSSHSSAPSHTGHAQSFTSIEGPSYGHHTAPGSSYGPPPPALYLPSPQIHHTAPAHTGPSSYSYGPPPSSHSISYKSPIASYGQHVQTKYGPPEVHYKHTSDYTKISTGPGPSGGASYHATGHSSKPQSVVQAAEVLRQILKNSPQTESHDTHYDSHPNIHVHEHPPQVQHHYSTGHKLIDQYDIPHDPIPPFRPMKTHPVYGLPLGPVESVTHSQSIITSYGAPPSGPSSHYSSAIESPAYNVYHKMSMKLGGQSDHSPSSHLTPPSSSYLDDNTAISLPSSAADDNHIHETQLNDLKRTLGETIEVQKSLTYEFEDQPHLVKRSDEAAAAPKTTAKKDINHNKIKEQTKSNEKKN